MAISAGGYGNNAFTIFIIAFLVYSTLSLIFYVIISLMLRYFKKRLNTLKIVFIILIIEILIIGACTIYFGFTENIREFVFLVFSIIIPLSLVKLSDYYINK